jgi:hypothetical protein
MEYHQATKLKRRNLIGINALRFVFRFLGEEKAAGQMISLIPLQRVRNNDCHYGLESQMSRRNVWTFVDEFATRIVQGIRWMYRAAPIWPSRVFCSNIVVAFCSQITE